MAENWGGYAAFFGRGAVSPSNTKSLLAEAYLHTKWNLDLCSHWPQRIWAEN